MDFSAKLSPVTKAFLAGSMSGTCSTLLFQPLDLVKTRQQASSSPSLSMARVARGIVASETITGLWRGMVPSVCRTVPGVGLYFSSMHWLRARAPAPGSPHSTLHSLLIGATARAIAATAMIPFTVLKTRYESSLFAYRGLVPALASILQTEGPRALYRGLLPTLVRDVPFSALYLACYEGLKASYQASSLATSSPPVFGHTLASLTAGLLASLATHPADVVKTKMQLAGPNSPGVLATVSSIYRSEGLAAFTVGLAPRLLRRTSMVALAWTVYERMLTTMALK